MPGLEHEREEAINAMVGGDNDRLGDTNGQIVMRRFEAEGRS